MQSTQPTILLCCNFIPPAISSKVFVFAKYPSFKSSYWTIHSIWFWYNYFKGSPADKADLEVGDEILEVNGRSLEDATHTEVISHIHQVRIYIPY